MPLKILTVPGRCRGGGAGSVAAGTTTAGSVAGGTTTGGSVAGTGRSAGGRPRPPAPARAFGRLPRLEVRCGRLL